MVDSELAFMVDRVVRIDGILVSVKGDVGLGLILFHTLHFAITTEDVLDGLLCNCQRKVIDEQNVELSCLTGELYWSLLRLHFWRCDNFLGFDSFGLSAAQL